MMPFQSLVGNDPVKQSLRTALQRGCTGHSLLFSGCEGVGKRQFAHAFAQMLAGSHPSDIHHFRPEGKVGLHSMESIRRLCKTAYLPPYSADRKVLLVEEADRMLTYSANALLKTFEEPPAETTLILISSFPERLLPTIRSRCWQVRFTPLKDEEIIQILVEKQGIPPEEAKQAAPLADGSLARARALLTPAWKQVRAQVSLLLRAKAEARFRDWQQAFQRLTTLFQEDERGYEISLRENLSREASDLPKAMREELEKEGEGMLSLVRFQQLQILIALVRKAFMTPSADVGERSFSQFHLFVEEAFLSLERSTPLATCLETLFLRLFLL